MPTKPYIIDVNQSSSNLILRWAKPTSTNGPLKNYLIEMTDKKSGTKKIWETDGTTQSFEMEVSQFKPGQEVSFRVRAANSLFKGEFSDSAEISIGHSVLEDSINNIEIVDITDRTAVFKWSKIQPNGDESPLNSGKPWDIRISYSIMQNHFAFYPEIQVPNDQVQTTIDNLSPGSVYTFR